MVIWGIGVGVYLLAVFHRTSLGVAGPQAAERLDLSAGQLSTFVMLQLGVYAAMQVPTGILVDRFGPRRMLLVATIIMGIGAADVLPGGELPAGAGGARPAGLRRRDDLHLRAPAGRRLVPGPALPGDGHADQRRRHGRQRGGHRAADDHAGQPRLGPDLRHRRWAVAGLRAAAAAAGRRRAVPEGGVAARARWAAARCCRRSRPPGGCPPAGSASGSICRPWPDPPCSPCCGGTRT